jgi:phenylalanyl-tRNA synthetase beta chain
LAAFGLPVDNLQMSDDTPSYYHPGRSATLRLGKDILAYCGELHPALLRKMELNIPAVGFEIFMDRIALPRKIESARPLLKASPFQAVERDFAFIASADQNADKLLKAARSADKELIRNVRLFDLYQGKNLPEGKKSLAITVTLQAPDRTLTEGEIESISGRVIAAITKATGAELRK